MTEDTKSNLPDQKSLEKEIGDYLSNKYGDRIKIVSAGLFPQAEEEDGKGSPSNDKEKQFNFDLKPEELVSYLDEYVIKQDWAKAVLATKICTHFNRIRFFQDKKKATGQIASSRRRSNAGRVKNNILLIGPTGAGKTFLVKLIADHLGVPFVKGDATKFSETGYVGGDVDDLVRDLVRAADDDIEKAEYGIIYVDEIDKIAHHTSRGGLDVSRSGVQRALLKPMEETEVDLKVPHDMISQLEAMEHYRTTGKRQKRLVNTKNILFIMSGAFDGLQEIVHGRLYKKSMGFGSELAVDSPVNDSLSLARPEDLVKFGFESEFIGRLPITAVLEHLDENDLTAILRNVNCPLIIAKRQDFMVYGIKLVFEDAAFVSIAKMAAEQKTGARALVSVVENILLPFEKKLPSTQIKFLTVTARMVANPQKELDDLLNQAKRREFHRRHFAAAKKKQIKRLTDFFKTRKTDYLEECGMKVTPVRLAILANYTFAESIDPASACDDLLMLGNHTAEWQEVISKQCGLRVIFSEEAFDYCLALEPKTINKVDLVCGKVLQAVEYGLTILENENQPAEIMITAAGMANPKKFINEFVEKN